MKKFLAALLTFALVLMILPTVALAIPYGEENRGYYDETEQKYSDVPVDHWSFKAVATCSQRDWFDGYPDGTFRPNQKIKRAEAAKVFAEALGLTVERDPEITFTDTGKHWAKAYIEATKTLFPNVQNLQGTSSFRPEQTITREETVYALVVAWRYASETENADLSVLNMFDDAYSISAAVKPYMAVAIKEKLVSGFGDRTIRAQDGLSRAQFATLLYKALNHGYGPDGTTAPTIALDRYPLSTPESVVTLTGQVTGEVDLNMTLSCDGEAVALDRNGRFSKTCYLEEGENRFVFTVQNLYGNASSKTVEIVREEEPVILPTIRLLSSVPEQVSTDTVKVNGKIEDYQAGVHLLTLDGKIVSTDREGYFELTLKLSQGVNSFEIAVLADGVPADSETIQIKRLETEGAGEWLSALPSFVDEENYNVETKEQSRSRNRETTTGDQPQKDGWIPDGSKESYIASWKDMGWASTPPAESETVKYTDQRSVVDKEGYTEYTYYHYWAIKDGKTKMSYGNSYWKNYEEVTVRTPFPFYKTYDGKYDGYKAPSVPEGKHGTIWWLKGKTVVPTLGHVEYRYSQAVMGYTYGFYRWSEWSDWTDGTAASNENTEVETRTMYRYTPKM